MKQSLSTVGKGGPFNCHMLLAPALAIGNVVTDSFNPVLQDIADQTEYGQIRALTIYLQCYKTLQVVHNREEFNDLCVAAALWSQVVRNIIPALSLTPAAIQELEKEFTESSSFRSAIGELASTDPDTIKYGTHAKFAEWMLENNSTINTVHKQMRAQLTEAANNHPDMLIAKKQAAELSAINFATSIALDIALYEELVSDVEASFRQKSASYDAHMAEHIKSVQQFQDDMQASDITFWQPPAPSKHKSCNLIALEASAAQNNLKRVQTLTGVSEDQTCVLNVVSMNHLGSLKKMFVDELKESALAWMTGAILIMHPRVPNYCNHADEL